jgi:hypothetical protein
MRLQPDGALSDDIKFEGDLGERAFLGLEHLNAPECSMYSLELQALFKGYEFKGCEPDHCSYDPENENGETHPEDRHAILGECRTSPEPKQPQRNFESDCRIRLSALASGSFSSNPKMAVRT